ncbi:hypothetical protein [Paraburkholderia caribensis]|uniref:hypothetical protein n=1 Tax=Paraburkholderia caribensis TaxID=75105 RepID=UPI001D0880E0|nr:hypothetical protein [Paraburkholderia caribensis]
MNSTPDAIPASSTSSLDTVKKHDTAIATANALLAFLAIAFYFLNVFPAQKFYPHVDEWEIIHALTTYNWTEWFKWLFAPHNDHRIPIPKLIESIVLWYTHFDFRWSAAISFLISAAFSLVIFQTAYLVRGYRHFGDLIFCIICLSVTQGYAWWGFDVEFLTSLLLPMLSAMSMAHFARDKNPRSLTSAFMFLTLSSMTGLSGVIVSFLMTVVFSVAVWLKRMTPLTVGLMSSMALSFVCNSLCLFTFRPVGVTEQAHFSIAATLKFFFGAAISSAGALQAPFYFFAQTVVTILVGCGLVIGFRNIAKKSSSYGADALTVLLCAQLIMLAGTAAVRSGPLPWGPGGEQHYGALGITLISASWILVSTTVKSESRTYLAVLLLLIFMASYATAAKWRLDNNPQRIRDNYAVSQAFKADLTPEEMLLLRPTQLMGISQYFPEVPQAIAELRTHGMHFYNSSSYDSNVPHDQIDTCHIDMINGDSVQETMYIPRKAQVEIKGWGFDPHLLRQPSTIGLMVADPAGRVRTFEALGDQPRDDIGELKGVDNAGIYAVLNTLHFASGEHTLTLVVNSGRSSYVCNQKVTISVHP